MFLKLSSGSEPAKEKPLGGGDTEGLVAPGFGVGVGRDARRGNWIEPGGWGSPVRVLDDTNMPDAHRRRCSPRNRSQNSWLSRFGAAAPCISSIVAIEAPRRSYPQLNHRFIMLPRWCGIWAWNKFELWIALSVPGRLLAELHVTGKN